MVDIKAGDFIRPLSSQSTSDTMVVQDIYNNVVTAFVLNNPEIYQTIRLDRIDDFYQVTRLVGKEEDYINPERYTRNKVECWDFWVTYKLDAYLASAVKYIWRHKYKKGKKDLEKAIVFLEKRITISEEEFCYPEKYTYNIPRYDDYLDMDNTQLSLLFFFSRIMVTPIEQRKVAVEELLRYTKEYMEEIYG